MLELRRGSVEAAALLRVQDARRPGAILAGTSIRSLTLYSLDLGLNRGGDKRGVNSWKEIKCQQYDQLSCV
jgi:hypothetical protein